MPPGMARRGARRGLAFGGKLDRYVLSLFTGSYAVAFLLVVGLFVILDLATKLDEYLQPSPLTGQPPSSWLIVEFYLLNLPFVYLQLAPFVTLLAGLFTLAKLLRHNEIVAALAAGISTHRLLLPVFASAAALALGMFGLREWFTEQIGNRRDELQARLVDGGSGQVLENLWLKDRAGNPVRLTEYTSGTPAHIRGLEATDMAGPRWINVEAERAVWTGGAWELAGGVREDLTEREAAPVPVGHLEGFEFTPADVLMAHKARERPMDLSFAEVRALAARDTGNAQYRTLLQYHLTFPLAHVVLLLVGLPMLLRHDRGRVEGVAFGFALCVFYFGADFISRSLGMREILSPLLASWLPVLFFGSLGIVLFGAMRS